MRTIAEIYKDTLSQQINEKLITFAGKAYPQSGHVVIMAGGAASGKGFVQQNLLGIEGKTFDVDALKSLAIRMPKITKILKDKFDIDKFDWRNSDHVSTLHIYLRDELGLVDKNEQKFFAAVAMAADDLKPNIIFDVTLRELQKLSSITSSVQKLGYKTENIHIIWVLNDIEIALKQNRDPDRERIVDDDILINTHIGVAMTMEQILSMDDTLKKYMDGDIILVFNKAGVDSTLIQAMDTTGEVSKSGGSYIKDANYVYLKKSGKAQLKMTDIRSEILMKMIDYVPAQIRSGWKMIAKG